MLLRNFKSHKVIMAVNTTAVLLLTWGFIGVGYAGEPGSAEDPIITQSYVDSKITEINTTVSGLKTKIDELADLKAEVASLKQKVSAVSKTPKEITDIKTRLTELEKTSKEISDMKTKLTQVEKTAKEISDVKTKLVEIERKAYNTSDQIFQVVEAKKNQEIICGASVQIVLRSGTAKVIASTAGGLSDLTGDAGRDLRSSDNVPVNHLLLIPRDDGRGIKITSASAWVMIKGKYEIK